jgi:hypothetical protein
VGFYLLGRDAPTGRVARWLWVLLLLVAAVQAVTVVGNSPFPWGSYEVTFEEVERSDRYPALAAKGASSRRWHRWSARSLSCR